MTYSLKQLRQAWGAGVAAGENGSASRVTKTEGCHDNGALFCYALTPTDLGFFALRNCVEIVNQLTKEDANSEFPRFKMAWKNAVDALKLANIGWEGDGDWLCVGVPGASDPFAALLFIIKQDNNGDTFVVSPHVLTHLETDCLGMHVVSRQKLYEYQRDQEPALDLLSAAESALWMLDMLIHAAETLTEEEGADYEEDYLSRLFGCGMSDRDFVRADLRKAIAAAKDCKIKAPTP